MERTLESLIPSINADILWARHVVTQSYSSTFLIKGDCVTRSKSVRWRLRLSQFPYVPQILIVPFHPSIVILLSEFIRVLQNPQKVFSLQYDWSKLSKFCPSNEISQFSKLNVLKNTINMNLDMTTTRQFHSWVQTKVTT